MRKIVSISIPAHTAKPLAGFWGAALRSRMGHTGPSDVPEMDPPDQVGPSLRFVEGATKVRIDIESDDVAGDTEMLLGFGAVKLEDLDDAGRRGVVLADPHGNELALIARPAT